MPLDYNPYYCVLTRKKEYFCFERKKQKTRPKGGKKKERNAVRGLIF